MAPISDIIDQYEPVLIQIATPYSTGTGFYLAAHHLIITNEHVVRGNRQVVIDGLGIEKQLVEVRYIDPLHDLAFLSAPKGSLPVVSLSENEILKEGESVLAIGHPFGLKLTSTTGIISNLKHKEGNLQYIQHDAALNPGNSGGPLITMNGRIAGVNTFIMRNGANLGFSLPVEYLKQSLSDYENSGSKIVVRCQSCSNLVSDEKQQGHYCPECGSRIEVPSHSEIYEPIGASKTIEDILVALGHVIELTRVGPKHWQIEQGSARITISYHEESGLVIGDAFLAQLPSKDIAPVYKYLLSENYHMENLSFSVKGNDIILSLIIYDRYLNVDTGTKLLVYLLDRADHYDNIIVEQYGARWKAPD